jgi:hypothetical protein
MSPQAGASTMSARRAATMRAVPITHMFGRLGAESLFKSFTLTANGVLTRNECILELTGDHGVAHVAGAALGDGATGAFLHDDTVFVTHDAVGCESRQVFKKVLKNGAVGVFQGKILVKAGAQKTDGYQISQSLLLDEDSQFLAKPELEIYADDVKCSHGSTTGAIDETALFYLRSRGVPREDATALLVLSFLADAIAEIEDEGHPVRNRRAAGSVAGAQAAGMSVTAEILATWRDPAGPVRRLLANGPREDRALVILIGACILLYVARCRIWRARPRLDPTVPLMRAWGSRCSVMLFVLPLLALCAGLLIHLIVRAWGGMAQAWGARMALFWALLAITPGSVAARAA